MSEKQILRKRIARIISIKNWSELFALGVTIAFVPLASILLIIVPSSADHADDLDLALFAHIAEIITVLNFLVFIILIIIIASVETKLKFVLLPESYEIFGENSYEYKTISSYLNDDDLSSNFKNYKSLDDKSNNIYNSANPRHYYDVKKWDKTFKKNS